MEERELRSRIVQGCRRAVIKVGSSLLVSLGRGLKLDFFDSLAQELAWLKGRGTEAILVSSGAIAAGMERLGRRERPRSISHFQATAAIGQGVLMHLYEEAFERQGEKVAQVLLTHEDVKERRRYLNARNTLFTLLEFGVIPIINENDSVAVEEIKFGDNDILAAMTAGLVEAHLLILLTDIEGLYRGKPGEGELLPLVERIDEEIEALAQESKTPVGIGGMATKLRAAKLAGRLGIPTIVAKGEVPGVIKRIWAGERVGTLFLPHGRRLQGKKRWIGFNLRPKGGLVVDEGAKRAITEGGKSLLPSGIRRVKGRFERGDLVICEDTEGREFARGLVNYNSDEVGRIIGRQSQEIEEVLGYKYADEVIHRDNLILT